LYTVSIYACLRKKEGIGSQYDYVHDNTHRHENASICAAHCLNSEQRLPSYGYIIQLPCAAIAERATLVDKERQDEWEYATPRAF
jgi:hypothetical protein